MAKIPDQIIDKIIDSSDIVQIVGSYLPLKKAGRNFKANCPFHNEKTPSFTVSPDKQIFHCFGCGTGGNVISFLMKHDNVSFREAAKILADKVSIKLPQFDDRSPAENSYYDNLIKVNDFVRDYYGSVLWSKYGVGGVKYLKERGLKEETIKRFQLGYAASGWDNLIQYAKSKNIDIGLLEKLGLILKKDKGSSFYDRFRNRIIFPILDARDRVIGFGGRSMGDIQPKYMNSPENPVYVKGDNLYGLNLAKTFIRKKDYVVIVEGYMDLIVPFQAGITNTVATLGTALTPRQIKLLSRFTKTVVMLYDADKAGEEASLRSLDLLISMGLNVRIASMAKGYDPDSFVRKFSGNELESILKRSKDLFDYKMELLGRKFNKDGVRGRAAIATLMVPTISKIPNEILKSSFLKKLAETLDIDEAALRAEMKKTKPNAYNILAREHKPKTDNKDLSKAEIMACAICIEKPKLFFESYEKEFANFIQNENIKKIIIEINRVFSKGKEVHAGLMMNRFDDEKTNNIIAEAVVVSESIDDKKRALDDCLNCLRKRHYKEKLNGLRSNLKSAQLSHDNSQVQKIMAEYNNVLKHLTAKAT